MRKCACAVNQTVSVQLMNYVCSWWIWLVSALAVAVQWGPHVTWGRTLLQRHSVLSCQPCWEGEGSRCSWGRMPPPSGLSAVAPLPATIPLSLSAWSLGISRTSVQWWTVWQSGGLGGRPQRQWPVVLKGFVPTISATKGEFVNRNANSTLKWMHMYVKFHHSSHNGTLEHTGVWQAQAETFHFASLLLQVSTLWRMPLESKYKAYSPLHNLINSKTWSWCHEFYCKVCVDKWHPGNACPHHSWTTFGDLYLPQYHQLLCPCDVEENWRSHQTQCT